MLHPTKKTKIIATIGPSSENPKVIRDLIISGVNVFRFNLKHNDHSWHTKTMYLVREIAKELATSVSIVADLQGPEVRTGKYATGEIILKPNEKIVFATEQIKDTKTITLNPASVVSKLKKDQEILIDDGKFTFKVIKIENSVDIAKVIEGGILGSSKSVSFPNLELNIPPLMPKDKEDIKMSVQNKVDYVALSFISNAQDILELKKYLKQLKSDILVIAKVEKWEAVNNIDSIIKETDAVMIARGDLAVEIPMERVPSVQKMLVEKCRLNNTPVIIATQMLKSMEKNVIPTRAEITDVANAVFEGSDAVMLSEESAMGDHPVKTVQTMAKILRFNELSHQYIKGSHIEPGNVAIGEALTYAAHILFDFYQNTKSGIKGFIVLTETGKTVHGLAKYRSSTPIFAFTQSETVRNQLNLSWGTIPFHLKFATSTTETITQIKQTLIKERFAKKGDKFIAVSGEILGHTGHTDTLRLLTI